LDFAFISDEANFHISGHVNKQNMCFWAQPHEHQYCPHSMGKLAILYALGCNGIIMQYMFEDADGCLVTVNTEQYIALM